MRGEVGRHDTTPVMGKPTGQQHPNGVIEPGAMQQQNGRQAWTERPSASADKYMVEVHRSRPLGSPESLIEIVDDVRSRFDADREPNEFLAQPGGLQLACVHLLVSGTGRVDHQGFGVADIGEVTGKAQGFDEFPAGRTSPFDSATDNRASPLGNNRCASSKSGWVRSDGCRTHSMAACSLRYSRTRAVLCTCRCMRRVRVLEPL